MPVPPVSPGQPKHAVAAGWGTCSAACGVVLRVPGFLCPPNLSPACLAPWLLAACLLVTHELQFAAIRSNFPSLQVSAVVDNHLPQPDVAAWQRQCHEAQHQAEAVTKRALRDALAARDQAPGAAGSARRVAAAAAAPAAQARPQQVSWSGEGWAAIDSRACSTAGIGSQNDTLTSLLVALAVPLRTLLQVSSGQDLTGPPCQGPGSQLFGAWQRRCLAEGVAPRAKAHAAVASVQLCLPRRSLPCCPVRLCCCATLACGARADADCDGGCVGLRGAGS